MTTCLVCNAEGHRLAWLHPAVELQRCYECGFAWSEPKHDSVRDKFYMRENVQDLDYIYERAQRRELARHRKKILQAIKQYLVTYKQTIRQNDQDLAISDLSRLSALDPTTGENSPRLLEIGCGIGDLLDDAQNLGFHVVGYETSALRAQFVHDHLGLEVVVGAIETASLVPESFDVIVIKNTLASVQDPQQLVRTAIQLLKPYGVLYIMTVNFDSWLCQLLKTNWTGLQLSGQKWFFTVSSLNEFMLKESLELQNISTSGLYSDYILSILHFMQKQSSDALQTTTPALSHNKRNLVRDMTQASYYLGGFIPYSVFNVLFTRLDANVVIEAYYRKVSTAATPAP